MLAVTALPRRPNPERGTREPAPELVQDGAEEEEKMDVNIARPNHEDRKGIPRELRITETLLDKFGLTEGCPGCMRKQAYADGKRPHNHECGERIYEAIMKDNDELDRLIQVEARMGRAVPTAERVRRARVDEADELNNPKDMEERKDADHWVSGGSAVDSQGTPREAEDDILELFMESDDDDAPAVRYMQDESGC